MNTSLTTINQQYNYGEHVCISYLSMKINPCKGPMENSKSAISSMIFYLHSFTFPDPSLILVELIKRISETVLRRDSREHKNMLDKSFSYLVSYSCFSINVPLFSAVVRNSHKILEQNFHEQAS